MAAYHSIAVTLGQAGLLKELINIIECMKMKPTKKLKNMKRGNWESCLEPDVVIYNAVSMFFFIYIVQIVYIYVNWFALMFVCYIFRL